MDGYSLLLLLALQASPQLLDQAVSTRPDPMSSASMRSDASLADVCFVDSLHGWAAGDRGTIWHTEDGGRSWQLQPSGVSCRLDSVWFLDERIGWAAGGSSHPYTHTSTAVLLTTRDGGRHWQRNSRLRLPGLKRVRFFDSRHGWAIGCSSAMFPSGAFRTQDGGRSWTPLAGRGAGCWSAGDMVDPHTGALAARSGTVTRVERGEIRSPVGDFGLRNLRDIKLLPPVHGWLVGDGALVMTTADLGASWQSPPGRLPDDVARHFDFRAVAARGSHCWIAGSPGTRVFHSADGGRTWTAADTGSRVPIHTLTFVDEKRGWAAGALGTILATEDGGRTWRQQRAGGTRAALLGLFADAADVPLELFARLSANDGYLGVVELVGRRDVEIRPGNKTPLAERLHEAAVAVGASGTGAAWRFPLRQPGLKLGAEQIIDGWDRVNDARGLQRLQAHIVRQIRLWRPEVIVTHDADPRGNDPLGHLVNQAVLQAVERAADPTSFAEQITLAGLQPWEVKKVYATLGAGSHGSTDLTTAQLATRLGRSLADLAAMPRALLEDGFTAPPVTLGFRLLVHNLPQDQGRRDFFSGIVLHPGGDARRELVQPHPEGLDRLRRLAAHQRNIRAILEQSKKDPRQSTQMLAQTGEIIRSMDAGGAGRILYHLAQRYYRSGRWPMAAETFQLLVDRYPDHALARPALVWLVQYYSAGEAAWRIQGAQRYSVRQASALSIDTSQQEDRPGRAAQLGRAIEQMHPELFAEDALRFPLAAAYRQQGFPRQAERFYLMRSRGSVHDAWWACAQGERWLAEPNGPAPKPVVRCAAARSKPRLDGRLDDAVWQAARPVELNSVQHDDGPWPAAVMLAYDAEFLYLAIQCRRAPGAKYAAGQGPRPRDADLSRHDRVDVLLDLDRDFATYYRLSIDHRGWVSEGCWGDATWNPNWFVAAATSGETWTAEAAIGLDQLSGRYPKSRDAWAVGIQRTVPGVGFQSFSTPAATGVAPEGFGYLIFE